MAVTRSKVLLFISKKYYEINLVILEYGKRTTLSIINLIKIVL